MTSAERFRRVRLAMVAAAAVAVAAPAADGGILESSGPACSIEFGPAVQPAIFSGPRDLSLLFWIRRETADEGATTRILTAGDVFSVAFDDAADGIRLRMAGAPRDVDVLIPLRDDSPETKVPVGEWILVGVRWEEEPARLRGWAQSESVGLVTGLNEAPGREGGVAWPMIVGAADGVPGFTGQLGLTIFREELVDATDVKAIWNGGHPHYFAPLLADAPNFVGSHKWMIGHGLATIPYTNINADAEGAEVDGPVTANNVLVWSAVDSSLYFSAGRVSTLAGAWTYRSPHEPGAAWSGFFVRELPSLGLAGPSAIGMVSPAARRLALDEPEGLVRVVASANSRGARMGTGLYQRDLENWGLGGVWRARRSSVAGVIVPAIFASGGAWPGFDGTASTIGTVTRSRDEATPRVSFGNFGVNGLASIAYPAYELAGAAVIIDDGSSYVPKARPEPGTRFDAPTDPLTVRAMVLSFPGAGDVVAEGVKASGQSATTTTRAGGPTSTVLDTTVVTRALGAAAVVDPVAGTITFDGLVPGLEIGHGCYVEGGPGSGGIALIAAVGETDGHTVITLERGLPEPPVAGASTLRFGPVEPVWVEHAWPGLEAGDPEVYRGLELTASGGIVPVLFLECFNPEADGFIVGGIGRGGMGYGMQLARLHTAGGIPFMRGIDADVWLQFFAHQGSSASSMIDYTDLIRAGHPTTEIWWCGDPHLEVDGGSAGTDAWQSFILDHATANGVGAIVAFEHPSIGIGNERAADGHASDQGHLSARGNELYVRAVLEMMGTVAQPDPGLACPEDLDGNGGVGFEDLVELLAAWGACAGCPADLDGTGDVGILDLLLLLTAWGACG